MAVSLLVCDTETTSLNNKTGDIIELALLDLKTGENKSWFLKPLNPDGIEQGALKVNGAKLEDLLWKTKEGKEKYKDPNDTLPEIENWIIDHSSSYIYDRILVGHNVQFDRDFMHSLWSKCNCLDSFPFVMHGNFLDTKQLAFFYDYVTDNVRDKYNLGGCIKKFGITNKFNYHGALEDTMACTELFNEITKRFKNLNK